MAALLLLAFVVVGVILVGYVESRKERERNRKPPIEEQDKKVAELLEYKRKLWHERCAASGTRKAILDMYLNVTQNKLDQEVEKLEAMRVEAEREEFERMMEK